MTHRPTFRDPRYLKRYNDTVFDLEQALVVPATTTALVANATQARNNLRFVVDNTDEMTPFDWYNARFSLDFRLELLATNVIAANDERCKFFHRKKYQYWRMEEKFTAVIMPITL